jgi:chromatin structure-remodeling complex protein RSC7
MSNPPRIVLKPRKAPTITLPRRRTLPTEEAPAASEADETGDGDAAMDVDVTVNDDAAEGANTPGRTPDVADGDADDGAGSLRDASEPGDDAPHPASLEAQSEVGPSRGRGRGRPRGRPRGSRGRGRGRGRGATTIRLPREDGEEGELEEGAEADDGRPQFKKVGTRMYVLEGDELATDDDPKGDTKIDKDGSLIGGEYLLLLCV